MASPRFRRARAHKKVRYTAGDITLNQTAITAVHASALDLTIKAQVGDDIEVGFSGRLAAAAEFVGFDVYSIVAATPINPFGAGLSASLATTIGVPGWYISNANATHVLTGSIIKTVVSSDLASGGLLTVRPYYAKPNVNARTLGAVANDPLSFWVKNLGPAAE